MAAFIRLQYMGVARRGKASLMCEHHDQRIAHLEGVIAYFAVFLRAHGGLAFGGDAEEILAAAIQRMHAVCQEGGPGQCCVMCGKSDWPSYRHVVAAPGVYY